MAVYNGTAGPDSSINDSTQSLGLRLNLGNTVTGKQDPRGDDTLFGFGDADILQGYGGVDSLFGQEGDDVLWGHVRPGGAAHAGNTPDGGDFLYGGEGNDELHGQDGDDYFDPGSGTNSVDGGAGSDDVNYVGSYQSIDVNLARGTGNAGSYATDTLVSIENVFGSHHADTITGNSTSNEIDGLGGNDTLQGGGGDDTAIFTGHRAKYQITQLSDGSLRIVDNRTQGEITADSVHATYQVSNGSDTVSGFEFFRFKNGTYSEEQLFTLAGLAIDGGIGRDTLNGTPYDDIIDGKQGSDTLLGSAGADQMIGGSGRDTVRYTRTVTLDLENKVRNTGQAAGDDFSSIESFQFANGHDKADGDAGSNHFLGGGGRDWLRGGDGNDVLYGQDGRDRLFGEGGNDRLHGGNDSDLLVGGLGRDVMNGNAGADRYDFNSVQDSRGGSRRDVVYLSAQDLIDLRTIDADADTAGNQRFRWVDRNDLDAAFTGRDGQLRFSNGILRGDIDGNKVADFEIRVFGPLNTGDVLL